MDQEGDKQLSCLWKFFILGFQNTLLFCISHFSGHFFQSPLWGPYLSPTSLNGLCHLSTYLLTLHTFPGNIIPQLKLPSMNYDSQISSLVQTSLLREHSSSYSPFPRGWSSAPSLHPGHIPIILPLSLLLLVASLDEWHPCYSLHQKREKHVSFPQISSHIE